MITLKKAKARQREFDPRDSLCPICGKDFRNGCGHSITQAYDRLKTDIIRVISRQEIAILQRREEEKSEEDATS